MLPAKGARAEEPHRYHRPAARSSKATKAEGEREPGSRAGDLGVAPSPRRCRAHAQTNVARDDQDEPRASPATGPPRLSR